MRKMPSARCKLQLQFDEQAWMHENYVY